MHDQAPTRRMDSIDARPVAELLSCPPEISVVLTTSATTIDFEAGQTIFRQSSPCEGLYLVVSGQLVRKSERLETRIVLGTCRPGDLVELAAALGDRQHTYSLVAQTAGSLLMLPMEALQRAFHTYPPLRMQLLEELAREVCRAYRSCSAANRLRSRRRASSNAA